MNEQPIRILVADDHPVFRFGLRVLLDSQPDTVVGGGAKSDEESVRMADRLQPDVVLMDVNMSGLNGIGSGSQVFHHQLTVCVRT